MKRIFILIPLLILCFIIQGCTSKNTTIPSTKEYINTVDIKYYDQAPSKKEAKLIDAENMDFGYRETVYALISISINEKGYNFDELKVTVNSSNIDSLSVYEANTSKITKEDNDYILTYTPNEQTKTLCLQFNFLIIDIPFNVRLTLSDANTTCESYMAISEVTLKTNALLFDFDSETSEYTFSGLNDKTITDLEIPSTINGYPVTKIGDEALKDCSSLTKVTIPDSIESIGDSAFVGCDGLINITIPNSVTSIGKFIFCNCSNLIGITIPNSVQSIGINAFYGCSQLTTINIPDGITSIGNSVYEGCSSLTSVIIPNSVTSIDNSAFCDCSSLTSIIIPDSVTYIGYNAFKGCSSLESITLPFIGETSTSNNYLGYIFGAKSYANNSIYVPSALKEVLVTEGCLDIASTAFYNCSSLTSIDISVGVTSIGDSVFEGCCNLISVIIPESVNFIGSNLFKGCTSLESITLPFIGNSVMESSNLGYLFNSETNYDDQNNDIPSSLKEINVIESCTNIVDYCFYGCDNLTKISLPNSVISIGDDVFEGCSKLQYNVYDNADYIGNENNPYMILIKAISNEITNCDIYRDCKIIYGEAFFDCYNLTNIIIPNSVVCLGSNLFKDCTSLESITLPFIGNSVMESSNLDYLFNSETNYDDQNNDIPSSLKEINVIESCTNIVKKCFYGCDNLTKISLPNSVISIGDDAFEGCSKLQYNVYDNADYLGNENNPYMILIKAISNEITSCDIYSDCKIIYGAAFMNCYNLTNITIPNGITSIGGSAFYWCSNLTSITIPESVTSIGDEAFSECYSLKYNIYLNADYLGNENNPYMILIKTISNEETTYNIHGDCRFIYYMAFCNCYNLTTISIPDGIISIGGSAFYRCSSLTSIIISNSVKIIGVGAFEKCSKLASITIPNSVTSIESCAFKECTSLTSITLPSSITSIESNVFAECSNLTSITLPSNVTSIDDSAFSRCSSLTSITIPDGVVSIESFTFELCSSLTSITIGNSVASIGDLVFGDCFKLTSINYLGTIAQWNSIAKIDNWNSNTGNYTIHCLDGDIAKS